jgi:hypothetical protein
MSQTMQLRGAGQRRTALAPDQAVRPLIERGLPSSRGQSQSGGESAATARTRQQAVTAQTPPVAVADAVNGSSDTSQDERAAAPSVVEVNIAGKFL